MSMVTNGDEVIILDPSYPAYDDLVREAGGVPIHVATHLENEWTPNLGELDGLMNSNTKMMILNSPANPTGWTAQQSWLIQLVELAISNDMTILSDEVYWDLCQTAAPSILQFADQQFIYVNSFSKTYGMTGFRLGYAVTEKHLIEKMSKLQSLCFTSVSEFIQCAGVAALDCENERRDYARVVSERMEVSSFLMGTLPVSFAQPKGGLYLFPRISRDDMDGTVFSELLLSETGISVTPGSSFGSDYRQFFRMSVCQPKNVLVRAIESMKEVLA
jgi:aspartate aminotransferase